MELLQSESGRKTAKGTTNKTKKLTVAHASRNHRRLELKQLRLCCQFGQPDLPLPSGAALSYPNHAELGFLLPKFHFQDRPHAHAVVHPARDQAAAADVPHVGWLSKGLRERVNPPQLHR